MRKGKEGRKKGKNQKSRLLSHFLIQTSPNFADLLTAHALASEADILHLE